MAKNKSQQTRTHTPKPIPALLEGSFSTAVENRIAEMNNHLAREGRLTNDPLAVMLRALRTDLKATGAFSFERVLPGTTTPIPTTVEANAPRKNAAPKKNAPPKKANTVQVSSDSVRVISPDEIESLQVEGSVDEENGAPNGKDAEGRALAPYGVKKDGSPMKRRGRVAAEDSEESEAQAAQAVEAAPEAVTAPTESEAASDFDDLDSVLADLDI